MSVSGAESVQSDHETYSAITEIDKHCKSLWPEWNPPELSVPRPKEVKTPKKQQLKPVQSPTLQPGSPIPAGVVKPRAILREAANTPDGLIEEVDELKSEVQALMQRIGKNITSPSLSPKRDVILSSIHNVVESVEEEDVIEAEVVCEEIEIEEPKPVHLPKEVQIAQPMRTKRQAKAAIAAAQKQIRAIQQENRLLIKQLKELKETYKATTDHVAHLRKSLKRNEAARQRNGGTLDIPDYPLDDLLALEISNAE